MKINLKNGDRSKWDTHSFDKIVNRIAETVDPNTTELDLYIGLEHIDAEDVHIRRTGKPSDVSGGKLRCYPNDVIFGKRRAYQRKAGIVTKAGICSAHSFVFRANENVISAKLLPFFLHSDQFMNKMIDISVGGLSPTINWTDLKHQKFLLPPKAQQAELADLLWSLDEVIEKDLELLEKLEVLLNNFIMNETINFDLKNKTISEILKILKNTVGTTYLQNVGTFFKGKGIPKDDVLDKGISCIRYGEIYTTHHTMIREFKSFISDESASKSFKLEKGDIIFAGSGETITEIGKSVCFNDNFDAFAGGDTIIFRPNKKTDAIYLSYLLNSLLIRLQLNKMGTGATVAHIYPADLKKLIIPKIGFDKQNTIAFEVEEIYQNVKNLKSKIQSSKDLQKSLINQLF